MTIHRVMRGIPYVPRRAPSAGLPDSVPPSQTYEVQVDVTWSQPSCPGQFIELRIINGSADNGTATVSPTSITASTVVTVTGGAQTRPGHAGNLKIQARLDGSTVKAESAGFTVCAHPTDFSTMHDSDIGTAGAVGFRAENQWQSDSGTFADLDQAERSEQVNMDHVDSPPFAPLSSSPLHTSSYISGTATGVIDRHQEPRPSAGPAGRVEQSQLFIFKCNRCGAVDKPAARSGFKIIHRVERSGTGWVYNGRKSGAAVTIGSLSVTAGSGTAARSAPVVLP